VCGPDVAYAMIRLTRGLASPRAGARHGFALALTEVYKNTCDYAVYLTEYYLVNINHLVDSI